MALLLCSFVGGFSSRADAIPAVSLTIDTDLYPPNVLLIRCTAVFDEVDGIAEECIEANSTYSMMPEQRIDWEAGSRRCTTRWCAS